MRTVVVVFVVFVVFVSMWWRGPHHIDLGNLGNLRKLKKVEQTVSFHAKTETRNRKFAKREEILPGGDPLL